MRKISFKKLKTKTSDSVQIIRMKTMNYPANIYWSWRRLKHVFSVAIFCLPRHLKDVLKTSWRHLAKRLEDVLKTCLEDVLKTYLEDVFKTSWKQTNLNVYIFDLANLHLTNLYLTNLRRIQNALIRTQ